MVNYTASSTNDSDKVHPILEKLTANLPFTGQIPEDAAAFLKSHTMVKTSRHCADVAALSRTLAQRFDLNAGLALQAGWLHDISAVIPNEDRVWYARELGVDILPEEMKLPMILHQKLSRVFAREIFSVRSTAILDAVECHTTLKRSAKPLDKVIFVADKLAWDQPGTPPYAKAMYQALHQSLDAAVCVYLEFLWDQRETLPVIHPWLVDAVQDLCKVE